MKKNGVENVKRVTCPLNNLNTLELLTWGLMFIPISKSFDESWGTYSIWTFYLCCLS